MGIKQTQSRKETKGSQSMTENELSKEILSGKITSESHILLDAFDDKIVFRNQGEFKAICIGV